MSIFKRAIIQDENGVPQKSMAGSGTIGNVSPILVATDANQTITVNHLSAGAVVFTGFTAGRNLTVPTAAQINAAAAGMDIGDSVQFYVSCVAAFAGTWVAATGVTLRGRATVPASGWSTVFVVKTGAATFDWVAL